MRAFIQALLQRKTTHQRINELHQSIKFETVRRDGLQKKLEATEVRLSESVSRAAKAFEEVNKNFERYNKLRVSSQAQIDEYREKEKVMQETIKALVLSVELNNKCRESEISHQVRIISAQGVRNS